LFVFGGYPEMNGMILVRQFTYALQITKFEENGTLRGTASKRRLGDVKAFLSPSPRYSMPGGPQSLNYEQL